MGTTTRAMWWGFVMGACAGPQVQPTPAAAPAHAAPPPAPPGYFACERRLREALRAKADADRARALELAVEAERSCAGVHQANAAAAQEIQRELAPAADPSRL